MTVFFLTLAITLVAIGGISLGLAFGRGPIRGSCGGLACGEDCACGRRDGEAAG